MTENAHGETTGEELHQDEQRLLLLINSIPQLIWVAQADGAGILSNNWLLEYLGKSQKQVQDRGWLETVHPDDRERASDEWARSLRTTREYTIEFRIRNGETGEYRWFVTRAVPYRNPAGQIILWFGTCTDIHKSKQIEQSLRESEKRFRTVLENLPSGVFVHDMEGNFLLVNAEAVKNTGYTKAELLKMKVDDIDPDSLKWEHRDRIWKNLTPGNPFKVESMHTRKDGARYPTELHLNAMELAGQPVILAISFNITDRKRSEEMLYQLNETLEHQVDERTALAEIRTKQLQSLAVQLIEAEERERQKFAQLLHDDLQQTLAAAKMQVQEVAERLKTEPALSNAVQLLEQSIANSRLLSHELSPAVLHHSGLIAALIWLAGRMKEQFGLRVMVEANADLLADNKPLKLFLFRSAQELLFNIVKHAGVKSAHIIFSVTDGLLTFSVSDQGQGFDPAFLSGSPIGIGFGLMAIRERASYIGGDLTIQSAPGKGSRFTLTVPITTTSPLKQTHKEEADQLTISPVEQKITMNANVIQVLFADDHKLMRNGLIQLLSTHPSIRVVGEASNGREALDQTRRLMPDVVLMDISMPIMDGFEATRKIKEEMPGVRIIGLSMYDDEDLANNIKKAGAEAVVSKTASTSKLFQAIFGTPQNYS